MSEPKVATAQRKGLDKTPTRRNGRRYIRIVGLNFLRGAASAAGAGIVSGIFLWLRGH
jgi:hypothetical protein